MPAKTESCVSSLMAKWKSDPKSKPKPKAGQDDRAMAFAICNASTKAEEEQDRLLLEGIGPTLMAVAITSKPHLPQRKNGEPSKKIELIDKDGKKWVKIPVLPKGIYRHSKGRLVFNDAFIDRLIENHRDKRSDYPVTLDFRHTEKEGTLAKLDAEDGGFLEKGVDNWLYAYGPVVDEEAEKIIASQRWPHASPDFFLDYQSNAITYKLEDMKLLEPSEIYKESVMPEKIITLGNVKLTLQEADGVYTLEDISILDQLQTVLKDLTEKAKLVDSLQAKIAELEKNTQLEEPEIPEPLRLRLEALETQNKELERQNVIREAAFTLERARTYRDENGRGHSKVFLDLAEAGLAMKAVEQSEAHIQLESQDEAGIAKYYRGLIRLMLEKVPGQVPMEPRTEGTEVRLETNTNGHNFTDDELQAAIEDYHKRY